MLMSDIELVVFDLAGTVMDFGCMAPAVAFVDAFAERGVSITMAQARGPMGRSKRDHLEELFALRSVAEQWLERFDRGAASEDIDELYARLRELQLDAIGRHLDVIPGAVECIAELRSQGCRIGATTGYFLAAAEACLVALHEQGITFDTWICADDVANGRPAPDMMIAAMNAVGVTDGRRVVKIGDTIVDVGEGRAAGALTVAVTDTGNEMALSFDDYHEMSDNERHVRRTDVCERFEQAGADIIVPSVADVVSAIKMKPAAVV
jgi:phosphonoacetaldehyde hydrolase